MDDVRLIDANVMEHQLRALIATAINRGVDNIPIGKDSSSAFDFLRGYERGATEAANLALGQPTLDEVGVVHGVWMNFADKYECTRGRFDLRCSVCKNRASNFVCGNDDWWDAYRPNYCPNCGAKMDGVQE